MAVYIADGPKKCSPVWRAVELKVGGRYSKNVMYQSKTNLAEKNLV